MEQFKKVMVKHFAVPLFIGMIVFLSVMLIRLQFAKDDWTIQLKDIEGDRSVLSHTVIYGELRDGFHGTQFVIDQGTISHKTEVFGHPHHNALNTAFSVWFDGVEYYIYNEASRIEFLMMDRTNPKQQIREKAIVRTSVSDIHTTRKNQTTYTNHVEYGLTKAGEQLFFTVPTTKHYVGMNGIYALEFGGLFDDRLESKRIVDLPLEVNREHPSLSVLGLEAVGDRLALILVDGEQLVVQVYLTDGSWVGQAEVPRFRVPYPDRNEEVSPGVITHYEPYEAFTDEKGSTLTLSFRSTESTSEEAVFTYLSFDVSDSVRWIGEEKGRYPSKSIDYNNEMFAQRVGDFLVVFRALNVEHERLHIQMLKQFMIEVFDHGQRVYYGELVTDVNDDLIEAMNQQVTGYAYSYWQHRRLYDIQIEPAR